MKKIFYPLVVIITTLFSYSNLHGQNGVTVDLFCEDFDTTVTAWKMVSSCEPSTTIPPCSNAFTRDTVVTQDDSRGAATAFINPLAQSYLTTPNIPIDSFITVGILFDHICYIDENDDATIQYSFNNQPWARLPASTYTGIPTRYDWSGDLKFDKRAEVIKWRFQDSLWQIPAGGKEPGGATVWVTETFDFTDLIGTLGLRNDTIPDSLRIRFGLLDDATLGRTGDHRWVIDNFCIRGADCELVPPQISLVDPPRNYPQRYEGRVYLTGPYFFDAQVLDNTGVEEVYVVANLKRFNDNTQVWDTLVSFDTIHLQRKPGNNFEGSIPKIFGGDTVQIGDTVTWKLVAVDKSDCRNMSQNPSSGFSKFMAINDLPPSCNTQPVFKYPYVEDFNGNEFSLSSPTILANDWANVRGDFHDWTIRNDSTPTAETGPKDDIPGGGKYLYVEASPNFKDSTAFLVTPCFDLNTDSLANGVVRFYVNMNTKNIADTMTVDVFDPTPLPGQPFGTFVENVVPPLIGNKDDKWVPVEFSIYPFRNTVTQIRFRATPSTNEASDIAIDSFKLTKAPLVDLRLNPFDLSPFSPEGNPDTAVVILQNLGVAPASNINFQFQIIQGGNVIKSGSDTWTGTIGVGESERIKLTNLTYDVPLGRYEYKAWLTFPGDNVALNDTSSSNSTGIPIRSGSKFMDNFDSDTLWLTSVEFNPNSLANAWEIGTPSYGRTNSAFTGTNSWDINLNRPYTGTGVINTLMSPFLDFSDVEDAIISFINNRDIDTTQDGVFLEVSFDRGLTWDEIVSVNDPGRIRWYNSSIAGGGLGGTPVLAGKSSCWANTWKVGWHESELYLPSIFNFRKEVLIRFAFFSENDFSGNDGISIDDVLIYDPDTLDLQPQFIMAPNSQCDMTDSTRVNLVIKNRGLNTVNSFELEYRLRHISSGALQVKTDLVDSTIAHRDTVHIRSASTLDFTALGDYRLDVVTKLPGDDCFINDTITKFIENIDGCSLRFEMALSHRLNNRQMPCDSGEWVFRYTSGGRSYKVARAYNDPQFPIGMPPNFPLDTIRSLFVCIKNNSQVRFDLNDRDSLIGVYSFIAFNGDNDTILKREIQGGPDSPTQFFDWNCPVEVSARPEKIFLDNDRIQLPITKEYVVDVLIENDGLDSIVNLDVRMQLDNNPPVLVNAIFSPDLEFRSKRRVLLDTGLLLTSGNHCITVWTSRPNGSPDQTAIGDTIQKCFTIMDTIAPPFCEDFENQSGVEWLSFNSYTYSQTDVSFELGTPSTTQINGANSGNNAWVTNLDGNYKNNDSSSVMTPFVFLEQDSCYTAGFWHNYDTDTIHDGGTFEVTIDEGVTWKTIGALNDTNLASFDSNFVNWYNTSAILAITGSITPGWSRTSGGWVFSSALINPKVIGVEDDFVAFRWRFESEGSKTKEGWAIDDYCFEREDPEKCIVVGLDEESLNQNGFYLGQNIPNPANYSTEIPFYLPRAGQVSFVMSNLLGQPVYEEHSQKPSGIGAIQLDLADLSKGVYYYWMVYEGNRISKKMIISK